MWYTHVDPLLISCCATKASKKITKISGLGDDIHQISLQLDENERRKGDMQGSTTSKKNIANGNAGTVNSRTWRKMYIAFASNEVGILSSSKNKQIIIGKLR